MSTADLPVLPISVYVNSILVIEFVDNGLAYV